MSYHYVNYNKDVFLSLQKVFIALVFLLNIVPN